MLHPQAQALLRLIAEKGIPPTHTLEVAQAREYYQVRRAVTQPAPPEVAQVRDLQAPGPHGPIPLRAYRPRGSSEGQVLPVLVYYHGGGWVIGDLETHDTLCRELSNGSGCAVVAVDYRMAPEHRFPAAVDDCVAATRWVHANAASLTVDASRLAVGGDSAGGNLAAVVALNERETGGVPIRFQLLIYPTSAPTCTRHAPPTARGTCWRRTRWTGSTTTTSPIASRTWTGAPRRSCTVTIRACRRRSC